MISRMCLYSFIFLESNPCVADDQLYLFVFVCHPAHIFFSFGNLYSFIFLESNPCVADDQPYVFVFVHLLRIAHARTHERTHARILTHTHTHTHTLHTHDSHTHTRKHTPSIAFVLPMIKQNPRQLYLTFCISYRTRRAAAEQEGAEMTRWGDSVGGGGGDYSHSKQKLSSLTESSPSLMVSVDVKRLVYLLNQQTRNDGTTECKFSGVCFPLYSHAPVPNLVPLSLCFRFLLAGKCRNPSLRSMVTWSLCTGRYTYRLP